LQQTPIVLYLASRQQDTLARNPYIVVSESTDLERLLEKPHAIDGKAITVVRQLPKKKLPLDPVKVHVRGISEKTTEDCLRFYLEKFSDTKVVEVYLGRSNDALATFESEPGNFESVTFIFTTTETIEGRLLIESYDR